MREAAKEWGLFHILSEETESQKKEESRWVGDSHLQIPALGKPRQEACQMSF